jgi:hypothetical protein
VSVHAIYRNRRARVVGDYTQDERGWVGAILDYGDGLTFGVLFGDPALTIEPTDLDPDEEWDAEWEAAAPFLRPTAGHAEGRTT